MSCCDPCSCSSLAALSIAARPPSAFDISCACRPKNIIASPSSSYMTPIAPTFYSRSFSPFSYGRFGFNGGLFGLAAAALLCCNYR